MTIDEAIELLEYLKQAAEKLKIGRSIDATQLGIEALKECKKARYGDPALDGELLPGETEE